MGDRRSSSIRPQGAGLSRQGLAAPLFAFWALPFASAEASQQPSPTPLRASPVQTIIVTGSRLRRANEVSASPIQTVTPQDFVLTGVPNVEQTLNQLPQMVGSFTSTSNNPGTGAATLNLRGLGSVRTLVLVNGRRWIASDAGEVPEVDVNTIPAALIERVDIVTGGASAAYGSDAVTGVVNFITNRNLTGIRLDARQALTAFGDARTSSADLSGGHIFADGRGRISGSIGWLDQAPVQQSGRVLSRVSLGEGCVVPGTRRETGASTAVSGACNPPNLIGFIAGGSTVIPGTRIAGRTLIPIPGTDRLSPATAGIRFLPSGQAIAYDPATDAYNFAPDNYLQVPLQRRSANLFASFAIDPAAEPYVELAYIETESPQQLAPVAGFLGGGSGSVPVARINLANPFLAPDSVRILELSYGVDAQGRPAVLGNPSTGFRLNPAYRGEADGIVSLPGALQSRLELGPRRRLNAREAVRGLIGLRGALSTAWDYDIYASHSRVHHEVAFQNSGSALRLQQALLVVRDPVTGQPRCIDPSNGCVPANIFGAGNLSEAAAAFIRTDPVDLTVVEEQVAELLVRGQFAFLAAGSAGVAVGTSWRRSAYQYRPDPQLLTGDDLGFQPGQPAAGSTRVFELFAEARLPLLADRPWVSELDAELGLRWSSYDTVGGVWTLKAMLNWVPVAGLRLRGGYQRAARAPNVRELYEAPTTSFGSVLDPCALPGLRDNPSVRSACLRNGVPANLVDSLGESFPVLISGGNPRLDEEVANTFTAGVSLSPKSIPGLSLALDYYDIRIAKVISVVGGGGVGTLFGCILGGADPTDPLCRAYTRNSEGSVARMTLPAANVPQARARGIDWQASYAFAPGGSSHRLELDLSGTRYLENSYTSISEAPPLDCAGQFGAPCGNTIVGSATPRWKLFNRATWNWRDVSMSVRHRWFSATRDARLETSKRFGLIPPVLPEEGKVLEGRHYFDVAATVSVAARFNLTLGINNLTDAAPALTAGNQVQANTDPSLYDVLGRRFFIAISVRQ